MASTVYSTRLFGPSLVTNAAHTKLYTVPAGYTVVLRSLQAWLAAGASRYVLGIGTTATTGNRFMNRTGAEFDNWDFRLVLFENEEIWGTASTSGGVYITASGYQLLGVPP